MPSGPPQTSGPDKCKKCNGSGTVLTNHQLERCPRCTGDGIEPNQELTESQRQAIGATGGAALGFSLGGPAGALVGGLIGAALTSSEEDDEEEYDYL
jgi:DnaJ-class molecular chaperone